MRKKKATTLIENDYAIVGAEISRGAWQLSRLAGVSLKAGEPGTITIESADGNVYGAVAEAYGKTPTPNTFERFAQDDFVKAACRLRVRVELVTEDD